MVREVFDDEARFRKHQGRGRRWIRDRLDAHDGRFAQRVDLFEGGGREPNGLPLVGAQGVGEVELFEEPEDALGAGFIEPFLGGLCVSGGLLGDKEGHEAWMVA